MIPTDLKNLPNYALAYTHTHTHTYLILIQTQNTMSIIFFQQVLEDKLLLILTCHLRFVKKILKLSIISLTKTPTPPSEKKKKKRRSTLLFPRRGGSG